MAGERLASDAATALLANALATAAGLAVLIACLGPVSGAHLNPLVTAGALRDRSIGRRRAAAYVGAQLGGALLGVVLAHVLFAEPLLAASSRARPGWRPALSEVVATFGLVLVVRSAGRHRPDATAWLVAAYVGAGYWFTSSTCFANPAVTLARAATDTFAGIRPADVPAFVAGQVAGAALGEWTAARLHGPATRPALVLFACVHGAGRSQMAAAFANALARPGAVRARAAGTEPASAVHPEVVDAMRAAGIDLSGVRPAALSADEAREAALLVTMGCGAACPAVPGVAREDWPLEDPKGKPREVVAAIRDDVRRRVERLLDAHGWR
jgi:glycerol uptake facilitator-like aquaporin/protein-tyrosine-phosphatase